MKNVSFFLALSFLTIGFSACNKDCFNPSLEEEFSKQNCPMDCPSVIGCDNKEYCNECLANKAGVAVKK